MSVFMLVRNIRVVVYESMMRHVGISKQIGECLHNQVARDKRTVKLPTSSTFTIPFRRHLSHLRIALHYCAYSIVVSSASYTIALNLSRKNLPPRLTEPTRHSSDVHHFFSVPYTLVEE